MINRLCRHEKSFSCRHNLLNPWNKTGVRRGREAAPSQADKRVEKCALRFFVPTQSLLAPAPFAANLRKRSFLNCPLQVAVRGLAKEVFTQWIRWKKEVRKRRGSTIKKTVAKRSFRYA